ADLVHREGGLQVGILGHVEVHSDGLALVGAEVEAANLVALGGIGVAVGRQGLQQYLVSRSTMKYRLPSSIL
ncbi:MAG: hypothetical protein WCA12_05355, partial [Burkholderiales bacterium]